MNLLSWDCSSFDYGERGGGGTGGYGSWALFTAAAGAAAATMTDGYWGG